MSYKMEEETGGQPAITGFSAELGRQRQIARNHLDLPRPRLPLRLLANFSELPL